MKSCRLCVSGISLLCLVVAMDYNSERVAVKAKVYEECAHLVGVFPETVLLVTRGKWPKNNDNLLLWVHCVLVKYEIMTDNGVFRIEVALRGLPENEAATAYNGMIKCLQPHNYAMIPEEISWEFAKCFQREDPEHSLF